jgi:anti-sigma factor (TIGR02949 family)
VTCLETARFLDAYTDDELDERESARFRAHLATCIACARAFEGRTVVRRAVRTLPYAAAPDRLRAAVVAQGRAARTRPRLAMAAAAMLILAFGTVMAVRTLRLNAATDSIALTIVADHVRALQSSSVIDVRSSDRHTVKPWFLGKIDFTPPVDDFASAGFPLAGGRLAQVDGRTVAVLVYQRRLHPIAVFVWPEADARARTSDARTVRGFNLRHWTAGGMSFWAVSDAAAADLDDLSRLLR